jgi:hypothetical protein
VIGAEVYKKTIDAENRGWKHTHQIYKWRFYS